VPVATQAGGNGYGCSDEVGMGRAGISPRAGELVLGLCLEAGAKTSTPRVEIPVRTRTVASSG